tara:strand:+ start:467 stop:2632 length:2166 start_codon:yes stop_codon:yes gene_type:complete
MANLKDKNFWSVRGEKSVADTQIDWSTVSKDITTTLETIRDERASAKQAIEDSTNEMMKELMKGEDINNATLSTALIDGGQSGADALQVQFDLLKKGLIKPKDYKIFMQKQQNAYTNLKNVVTNWDAWDTKSKERLAIDPATGLQLASQLEQDFNISTSAFGNMENVKFIPTEDGGMEAVRFIYDEDTKQYVMPDRDTNPENFMNPNVIGARQRFEMNTTDITTSMKKQTDALGTFLREEQIRSGRIFQSVEDFKDSPSYLTAKEDAIKALSTTDLQKANIAGQMGYRFAMSEAQKTKMISEGVDASKIIMYSSNDGRPNFKDDAFDNVGIEEFLGNRFDSQLTDTLKLEKGIDPIKPTSTETQLEELDKLKGTTIKDYNKILTSDNLPDVQASLEGLIESHNQGVTDSGKGKTIVGYNLTDSEIIFKYSDGSSSDPIERVDLGPDGELGTDDDTDVDIQSQIYAISEALTPDVFRNSTEVSDWISENNFEVGEQRRITSEQADAIFVSEDDNDKKIVQEAKERLQNRDENPIQNPTSDQIKKEIMRFGKDAYEVDLGGTEPFTMDDATGSADDFSGGIVTPNEDTIMNMTAGINENLGDINASLLQAVNSMFPQEMIDYMNDNGFPISISLSEEGYSDKDANQIKDGNVDIVITIGDEEYRITQEDAKEKYASDDISNVPFYSIMKDIEKTIVRNTYNKVNKKRGKKTQKGNIGGKPKGY